MNSKKLKKIWPRIRNSVNTMGRNASYKTRDAVRQWERAENEERQVARREALLQEQIATLQNEVVSIRNAAGNHIFSQYDLFEKFSKSFLIIFCAEFCRYFSPPVGKFLKNKIQIFIKIHQRVAKKSDRKKLLKFFF